MMQKKIPAIAPENSGNRTNYHPISPDGFLPREVEIRATRRDVIAVMADYSHGYLLDWHRHERIQLIYPSTGVIHLRTPTSISVATPERGILIPPRLLHQVKMHGTVEMRSLYFNPWVLSAPTDACCFVDISPMLREMLRYAVNMPREYEEQGPDGRLVKVIIDQIVQAGSDTINLPLPGNPKIQWIEQQIMSNPAENRSLDEWAESLGVSSRTLSRAFRQDIAIPFRDWRSRLRLVAALQFLAEGKAVAETAHRTGFHSESAFIERFKRMTGVTPGRYYRRTKMAG